MDRLLQRGDTFHLKAGQKVYAQLPFMFVYENRPFGHPDALKLASTEITIGTPRKGFNTSILEGHYVVTLAVSTGGGCAQGNDRYPDGWQVTAKRLHPPENLPEGLNEISFYQTGAFTAMIRKEEIEFLGETELQKSASAIAEYLTDNFEALVGIEEPSLKKLIKYLDTYPNTTESVAEILEKTRWIS